MSIDALEFFRKYFALMARGNEALAIASTLRDLQQKGDNKLIAGLQSYSQTGCLLAVCVAGRAGGQSRVAFPLNWIAPHTTSG
jgi:hypothetical protein